MSALPKLSRHSADLSEVEGVRTMPRLAISACDDNVNLPSSLLR